MLTLVLPIAGAGSRFADAGYDTPKPFIDIDGMTMVERAISNLPEVDQIVLIALNKHWRYIPEKLQYNVVGLERVTAGEACSVLAAENVVPDDNEMIVADCDQWLDWSPDHFLSYMRRVGADGGMTVFHGLRSHWSYVHLDSLMGVESVIEKVPVSDHAVAGVRYFQNAGTAFGALDQMVSEPVEGEYHLGAVFNDLIRYGKRIVAYPVPRVYSLGTPEEMRETLFINPWEEV